MPKKKAGKEKKLKKASKEDVVPTHNKKFGIKILLVSLFLVLLIIVLFYSLGLNEGTLSEERPPGTEAIGSPEGGVEWNPELEGKGVPPPPE